MSWPNFLEPLWGWMGLLAVPVVLLYLLRQKRPELAISSTLLWSRTMADLRASTPFQKLRRNLLLLLQLIILAALVFTLMRPVIQAQARQTKAGVIVIDATASMQTTDNGGPSRLERAENGGRKLVDSMRPGDKYKVDCGWRRGLRSASGIDFSEQQSEVKGSIDAVKTCVRMPTSDLSESLILATRKVCGRSACAQNAGRGGRCAEAAQNPDAVAESRERSWLFSDGAGVKIPDVMGPAASLLQFVKIGESDRSVGITQLSITPVPKEARTYQVVVGIKNASEYAEAGAGCCWRFGGKDKFLPGQAKAVDIPAGRGVSVFEKVVSDPGKVFCAGG